VQLIDHLKKGDMAREAERLLDATAGCPSRSNSREVGAVEQNSDGEAEALPEFLAATEDEAAAACRRRAGRISSRRMIEACGVAPAARMSCQPRTPTLQRKRAAGKG